MPTPTSTPTPAVTPALTVADEFDALVKGINDHRPASLSERECTTMRRIFFSGAWAVMHILKTSIPDGGTHGGEEADIDRAAACVLAVREELEDWRRQMQVLIEEDAAGHRLGTLEGGHDARG